MAANAFKLKHASTAANFPFHGRRLRAPALDSYETVGTTFANYFKELQHYRLCLLWMQKTFFHSFILRIYIAPPEETYREAL